MFLKVKDIILYPNNTDLRPRVIRLEEKQVNVITGYSQRGKSAIINIIDYCLGSEECNVSIGTIRNYVSRYALNINLGDKFLFVARDNPEGSSNTYMYFEIDTDERSRSSALTGGSMARTSLNQTVMRSKYVGEIAGFKNFAEKYHDKTLSGFDAPASFRDTTAFQFQPHNIIANPTTIFYNTDSF